MMSYIKFQYMLTLTQASVTARKSIRYILYFIVFLIVGRIFLDSAIGLYKKLFPPEAPPPTVAFGKLPSLPFPERAKLDLNFVLETPEGGLPTISDQAKVYFMPKLSANLLSLDFTKEKAKSLGYNEEPTQIDDSTFEFTHKTTSSKFKTDIITGAFSLSYDLIADPTPLTVNPPSPEIASSTAKSFLENANSFPDDLTGPTTYEFLKQRASGLIPTTSLSDANLIKTHIFRKSYDELPSLTSTPNEANVWFILSGLRDRGRNVIAGEFHYFPIDEEQVATYPIKTPDQAWGELNNGNYFTASFGSAKPETQTKIRRVYLAYYDPGVPTDFFQPIYVFEATDKNFTAYVPAVTLDYYGE